MWVSGIGAHPGFLCCTEAEEKLLGSLGLDEGQIPFQLTSRTISVPIQDGAPIRFGFQALVIECSAADAPKLKERFYELDRPTPKDLPLGSTVCFHTRGLKTHPYHEPSGYQSCHC